ncbi:hypothetical protein PAGL106935_16085 [Paenibacillus glucanolyticus]
MYSLVSFQFTLNDPLQFTFLCLRTSLPKEGSESAATSLMYFRKNISFL